MSYSKKIVCLANSKKNGGRCVAGKELLSTGIGGWIRPISTRDSAEINMSERQYKGRTEPELLDIIAIHLLRPAPKHHQLENHLIDSSHLWRKEERLAWNQVPDLLDAPPTLWSNGHSTIAGINDRVPEAESGRFQNSLLLIQPEDLIFQVESSASLFPEQKKSIRAKFQYRGTSYGLKVTDLAVQNAFATSQSGFHKVAVDCYFCVSLAEAHTDGYCYKLIAAVLTKHPL